MRRYGNREQLFDRFFGVDKTLFPVSENEEAFESSENL